MPAGRVPGKCRDACSDACDASGLAFAALLGQGGRSGAHVPAKSGRAKHEARSGHRMAGRRPRRGGLVVMAPVQGTARAVVREPARRVQRDFAGPRWVMAFGSTALAYAALAWYDRIGLLHLGRKISWLFVGLTSFVTYAIAHNLGASVFSGALIRYRAYSTRGLSMGEVGLLVAFCSFTFGLGAATLGGAPAALPARAHRALRRGAGLGRAGGGRGPDRRPLPLYARIVASFPGGQGRRRSR